MVCDSQTSINPTDLIKVATFVQHVWLPVWDNPNNSAYTDLIGLVTGALIIFNQELIVLVDLALGIDMSRRVLQV